MLCCIGALSYTQLSGPEDCCPSPVGSIVPICKWTSARCHPQTQRRRQPAIRWTKSTTTTETTTIHMSICSYRPCDLSLSIGFTTSWLRRHRRGWNRRRGTLANLAALIFRLSFILPTDFLCISFRSLRAANMQKLWQYQRRKRGTVSCYTSVAHVPRAFRVINGINIPS